MIAGTNLNAPVYHTRELSATPRAPHGRIAVYRWVGGAKPERTVVHVDAAARLIGEHHRQAVLDVLNVDEASIRQGYHSSNFPHVGWDEVVRLGRTLDGRGDMFATIDPDMAVIRNP